MFNRAWWSVRITSDWFAVILSFKEIRIPPTAIHHQNLSLKGSILQSCRFLLVNTKHTRPLVESGEGWLIWPLHHPCTPVTLVFALLNSQMCFRLYIWALFTDVVAIDLNVDVTFVIVPFQTQSLEPKLLSSCQKWTFFQKPLRSFPFAILIQNEVKYPV